MIQCTAVIHIKAARDCEDHCDRSFGPRLSRELRHTPAQTPSLLYLQIICNLLETFLTQLLKCWFTVSGTLWKYFLAGILMTCIVITWNIVWIMAHVDRIIRARAQNKPANIENIYIYATKIFEDMKNIWVAWRDGRLLPGCRRCCRWTPAWPATASPRCCPGCSWCGPRPPPPRHFARPENILFH